MQDKIHTNKVLTGEFLFLLVATTLLCFWIGLRPFEPASAASVSQAVIEAQPATAQTPVDLPAPIASLADLINDERTTRSLAPLQLDSRLSASATSKAQHIVTHAIGLTSHLTAQRRGASSTRLGTTTHRLGKT